MKTSLLFKKFNTYYPNSEKVFFPKIEFKLDIAFNQDSEEINILAILLENAIQIAIENLSLFSKSGFLKTVCYRMKKDLLM